MKKALEGITVLDFSQLLAGPFATMMLGDLGAEIIKIERANTGDIFRDMTLLDEWLGGSESPCYMAWNRNKKSLAVNMKDDRVKAILYDMVKKADVVIENFRPGVMDKLGYGYETLKKINPQIVYASNSGFGSSGPYVTRPGQDMLIQGMVGITTLTGQKDAPPTPIGTGLPDMLSSFHLVYGILSALLYAQKTGEGQHVEVDLMRSTMALESQEFMTLLNSTKTYERPNSGIGHPFQRAPFGIYKCSNGHISIAMGSYKALTEVLNAPELLEYEDPTILYEQRDKIFNMIEEVTKTNTVEYWLEKMLERDLWVAKVNDITEVEHDPQVQHAKALTEFEHKKVGKVRCVAPAVSFSETPATIELAPPLIGEHTTEILKEYGVSDKLIEELYRDNAISKQE